MVSIGRRLLACSAPGTRAYVVAGDETGATVFATADAAGFTRGPDLGRGLDEGTRIACNGDGVLLWRAASDGLRLAACNATRCTNEVTVAVQGEPSVLRGRDVELVADGGGESGLLRVRRLDLVRGTATEARIAEPVPRARAVRLVRWGDSVMAFAAGAETHALLSRDGGTRFEAVVVDRPAGPVLTP
jgi:hypothetical protein